MEDHIVLQKALKILGWDEDRLLNEISAEESNSVSKVTVYRWLTGKSPVHPGVKAFLRERIQNSVPMKPPKPKPSTRVLTVGPAGSGKTPMAYELAACASKAGIVTRVVQRGYEEAFAWSGVALGEALGMSVSSGHEDNIDDVDLVFVDNVNPWSIWEKDDKDRYIISETGADLLKDVDAILMIGSIGDLRLETFVDLVSTAKDAGKVAFGCLGVRSNPCVQFTASVAKCAAAGVNMTFYHEPDPANSLPFFKRCLGSDTTKDDLVTGTIWNTMYWLIDQLGWPDTLSQVSGGKDGMFRLSLAQIVQAYSADGL
jgi:hypothetical protein